MRGYGFVCGKCESLDFEPMELLHADGSITQSGAKCSGCGVEYMVAHKQCAHDHHAEQHAVEHGHHNEPELS